MSTESTKPIVATAVTTVAGDNTVTMPTASTSSTKFTTSAASTAPTTATSVAGATTLTMATASPTVAVVTTTISTTHSAAANKTGTTTSIIDSTVIIDTPALPNVSITSTTFGSAAASTVYQTVMTPFTTTTTCTASGSLVPGALDRTNFTSTSHHSIVSFFAHSTLTASTSTGTLPPSVPTTATSHTTVTLSMQSTTATAYDGSDSPSEDPAYVQHLLEGLALNASLNGAAVQATLHTSAGVATASVQRVSNAVLGSHGKRVSAGSAAAVFPAEVAMVAQPASNETVLLSVVHHQGRPPLGSSHASDYLGYLGANFVQAEVSVASDGQGKGRIVPVSGLKDTVRLLLPVERLALQNGKIEKTLCVWWNETAKMWTSLQPQQTVSTEAAVEQGAVSCSSTHLSLFGTLQPFHAAAGNTSCTRLSKVLSRHGLELLHKNALSATMWLSHPAGILLLALVCMSLLQLLVASVLDHQARWQHGWCDEDFLLDWYPPQRQQQVAGRCTLRRFAIAALVRMVHLQCAASVGCSACELPSLLRNVVRESTADAEVPADINSLSRHRVFASCEGVRQALQTALVEVTDTGFLYKILRLMLWSHPICDVLTLNITSSYRSRAMLHIDAVLVSLLVCSWSLSFTAQGDAGLSLPSCGLSVESPLLPSIIGCSAAVSMSALVSIAGALVRREFKFCRGWSPEQRNSILRRWRGVDGVMFLIGLWLPCFGSLYTVLFLAQVGEEDRFVLFWAGLASILTIWVALPFVTAMVLGVLVELATRKSSVLQDAKASMGLTTFVVDVTYPSAQGWHRGRTLAWECPSEDCLPEPFPPAKITLEALQTINHKAIPPPSPLPQPPRCQPPQLRVAASSSDSLFSTHLNGVPYEQELHTPQPSQRLKWACGPPLVPRMHGCSAQHHQLHRDCVEDNDDSVSIIPLEEGLTPRSGINCSNV